MMLGQQQQSPFASAQAVASVLGKQLMALNPLSSQDLVTLYFANQQNIPTGAPAFQPKLQQVPEQRLSEDSGIEDLGSIFPPDLDFENISDCASDVSEVFEGEKISKSFNVQEQSALTNFELGFGAEEINQFFNSLNATEISKPPNPDVFTDFSMLDFLESALPTDVQAPVDGYQSPMTPQSSITSPYQSPSHSIGSPYQSCTDESGFESDFDTRSIESPIPDPKLDGTCMPLPDEKLESQVVPEQPPTIPPPPRRRRRGPKKPAKYNGTGPIQLWQFLLELILNPQYSKLIEWTYDEKFEFKLLDPPKIATMWGKRKNKPNMNYEKLSRGLRYYYGKSILDKVHGKRYVYQFVCDITKILGYDPTEQKLEGVVEDAVCGELETVPNIKCENVEDSVEETEDLQIDWDSLTQFVNSE